MTDPIHQLFQIILFVSFIIAIIYRLQKWLRERAEKADYERRINRTIKVPQKSPEAIEAERQARQQKIKEAFDKHYQQLLDDKYFVNKGIKSLDDYVINADINEWDLHKLAELNRIYLQIRPGWYDLLKKLMIELDQNNWNRKVGCIKEKFGELRFYADFEDEELIDKYTELSKTICEICGEKGEHEVVNGWYVTLCEVHLREQTAD